MNGTAEPSRLMWWGTLAAACVLLLLPLAIVDVPPLLDYPNHLARLFVLAHPDDPVLSKIYAQHWTIVPNLAIDLLAPPLLSALPVHVAGRIIVGVTLLLPVIGCTVYSRAVFGRRSLWPLASAIVATNGLFFLGFLNFQIALALALLAAAGWHAWSRRRPAATMLAAAVVATGIFFCHIFGLAFFGLLIGSEELAILRARHRDGAPLVGHALRRGAMLAIVFCVPVLLYMRSPLREISSGAVGRSWAGKLYVALDPFAHYLNRITLLTAGLVALAVYLLARSRQLRAGPGTLFALAVLALVYLAAPTDVKSTGLVDARLPVMAGFLLFAGFAPAAVPPVTGAVAAALLATAFVVRTDATALVWHEQVHDVAGMRAAIAPVEAGARVLVVGVGPESNPAYWAAAPANRVMPGYARVTIHLASLLLIEHRAFWPLLFTAHAEQSLVVLPPYDRIATEQAQPPELSQLSDPRRPTPGNDTHYVADWQHDFDYVLLLDPPAAGDPARVLPDKLTLLVSNDVAALYRVRRP